MITSSSLSDITANAPLLGGARRCGSDGPRNDNFWPKGRNSRASGRLCHKKCKLCGHTSDRSGVSPGLGGEAARGALRGVEASRFRGLTHMKKLLSVVAVAAAVLCFTAAAYAGGGPQTEDKDAPPTPLPPLQKNFPLDQTWSLRELNGKPVPSGVDVSLKIDGTLRGSGYTGCNSWSATMYPVKDQHLAVGPYALTKKQCGKDIMALEMGFLSGLLGSPEWDLVNGDLVIKGPRGTMRLARSL